MSQFLQIFCTILSSLLIAIAIPNEFLRFGSPIIGLIALFPFYIAMYRSKSLFQSFMLCFIHGALAHLLSSFWLGNFAGFAIFTLGASDLGTGFFEGFFSLGFYFPILFSTKSKNLEFLSGKNHFTVPFRIFWFASIYTIWEYCKSTGFLAYPWGTISMTAYDWPLITQIADISGVYGVTFLFALFSACLGEGTILLGQLSNTTSSQKIFQSYKKSCMTALILFSAVLLYGSYELLKERKAVKVMDTILVQQNRNPNRRQEEENILMAQNVTQNKINECRENKENCDLVVWSEAVLSKRFPSAESYYTFFPSEEPLIKFIKKNKIPFIIGGPVVFDNENHEYGNSALLFDKNGSYQGAYTKMHLVPFAELVPFRDFDPMRKLIKRMVGFSYGWTPGKKPVLFEIPLNDSTEPESDYDIISIAGKKQKKEKQTVLLSTPICFDDSANEVCRALYLSGSEVFVNITNDSWSKTESSEIQHFVVAHYRSIEYRTTTIRSANSGYTVVVDPTGRILADLPLFTEDALYYKVPVYNREMTVYARYGNWLPYSLILLAFAYIFICVEGKKEEEKDSLSISTILLPHSIFWYDRLDFIIASYEEYFAIDWNNWNM
ncbi:MAG: apolipoprotein N-acyltransferase [Treponema sp.]|nr:apolipoprotein N-acyltransferase [Treponema sp.]